MNSTKLHLRSRAVVASDDRRSQRVMIRVPVTFLTIENGQAVFTAGKTVEVNTHGAVVACSRSFASNTKVEMVNEATGEKISSRVLRSPREGAEGFVVPVEFTAPSTNFWQITFPPNNWKPPEGA